MTLLPQKAQNNSNKDHNNFRKAVDDDRLFHVCSGEFMVVGADIRLVEHLAKIDMRTTKTTVEDACQGGFGVT